MTTFFRQYPPNTNREVGRDSMKEAGMEKSPLKHIRDFTWKGSYILMDNLEG
jgi:hypothetical protein